MTLNIVNRRIIMTPALAGGGGPYTPQGVRFDGSTTSFTRGSSGLIGASNSVKGLMSFWFLMQGSNDGVQQYFCTGSTGGVFIFPRRDGGNGITISCRDAGSTDSVVITASTATYTTTSMAGVWAHCIASWDGSLPRAQLYVDGVNIAAGGPTITNVASNYAATDWAIGSRPGTSVSQMDIADFYFDQTTSLDLSVAANIQKFRDVSGNAVDLGPTGSIPLGSQPILCFTGGTAGWGTNKGSGGNFTSSGTFANSPTSPP